MPEPVYVCDFVNQKMGEAVRDAFAKFGLSTQGEFADIPGPGPVEMVRLIRDPTGAFPRAAVFLSIAGENRTVVICTYRDGRLDKQMSRILTPEDWERGQPEALPLALREVMPRGRRRQR